MGFQSEISEKMSRMKMNLYNTQKFVEKEKKPEYQLEK